MYSHLALETLPRDSSYHKNIEQVLMQGERCQRIVKGLLDFSRQREPEIESVNVNDIIEEILSLVETQALFQNIEIIKALNPNLPRIMGDKSQLQQVFINLTLNAAEAMEDGGKLIVNSSVSGGSVKIEFTDSGSGIPPEHIEKIFEPFFSVLMNGPVCGYQVGVGRKDFFDVCGCYVYLIQPDLSKLDPLKSVEAIFNCRFNQANTDHGCVPP